MRAQKSLRKLVFLILGLIALATATPAVRAEVLLERVIVLTGEWAPFTSDRMDDKGLLSGLVTEILRGMRLEPEYHFLPFSEAMDLTETGSAFGTFPWFPATDRTPERSAFVYSNEILKVDYVVFYNPLKGLPVGHTTSLDELKCLKTARVKGYAYGDLDALLDVDRKTCPGGVAPAEEVDSEFLGFKSLADGNIDFFAANKAVGESLIRRSFSVADQRKFAVLDQPDWDDWSMPVHFLFPRDRPDADALKTAFDNSLATFKDSGRVAEVERQLEWIEDWQDKVVALTNPDGGPVTGQRDDGGTTSLLTVPRGNRAVVLEWSERFAGNNAGSKG